EVSVIGNLPDGTQKKIDMGLDVEATAAIGIDPWSNAVVATPTAVDIKRMEMDQVYAEETGFDVTRMKQVLNDFVIPKMLNKMGTMALTGPVFAKGEFAVILRAIGNNQAYVTLNADLFKIPTDDIGAPETSIIAWPFDTVAPKDAVVQVSAVDGMIP